MKRISKIWNKIGFFKKVCSWEISRISQREKVKLDVIKTCNEILKMYVIKWKVHWVKLWEEKETICPTKQLLMSSLSNLIFNLRLIFGYGTVETNGAWHFVTLLTIFHSFNKYALQLLP